MLLEIGSFPAFSDQEKKALIWLFSVIFPRAFFCESGFLCLSVHSGGFFLCLFIASVLLQ